MIDLYFAPTPNGWKVAIMLEELGLPYRVVPVNLALGEQFAPEFTAISPNNRIPAIVDHAHGGVRVFESGAILLYLAEQTGRFCPLSGPERYGCLQWLFWQVGGLGPMGGQASHFINYVPEGNEYARSRYLKEYDRLLGVLDRQLANREYLAGEYSIADIAVFPWLLPYKRYGQNLEKFAPLRRWFDNMKNRPAVRRGVDVGKEWRPDPERLGEKERATVFNQTSDTVRGFES